jgi:Bromodomain
VKALLQWLQKSKHAARFSEPVDAADFDNDKCWQRYQKLVPLQERMDLGTVRQRVNKGHYGTDGNG